MSDALKPLEQADSTGQDEGTTDTVAPQPAGILPGETTEEMFQRFNAAFTGSGRKHMYGSTLGQERRSN